MGNRRVLILVSIGVAFVLAMIGTAVAGLPGATERETLIRARVWCDALVDRDALRYQESFRRGYFPGRYDRVANLYREPTEDQILAQMPITSSCQIDGKPRGPDSRNQVFVTVVRTGPEGETKLTDLRMRRESGFWVVWQLVDTQ